MTAYNVSTKINASAESIWSILTDGARYPQWNETVTKIEGTIALGKKIKVFAKISLDRAFAAKVVEFVPNKQMIWQGGMPLGLFKGVRTFTLVKEGELQIEFNMKEEFSGLMAPLITKSIPDLTEPFEQFAAGLKREAERSG